MATECEKCKDTGTLPQQGWAWREGDRGYYWCECSAGVARKNADLRQEAEDESRAANPLPSRRQVAELEARVATLTEERDALKESRLPRTDDPRYDLKQRLNRAVRWLREAEDMARVEMAKLPTADRIRSVYEQVTEDVLNGTTAIPPVLEQLREAKATAIDALARADAAEREAATLREALEAIRARSANSIGRGLTQCHDIADAALAGAGEGR